MARIPAYTTTIVRPREVAQLTDPSAISAAGSTARGVAQIAGYGADIAFAMKEANDKTALNQKVLEKQRADIDYLDQRKKDFMDNPTGFSKIAEQELKKRDEEFEKALPSTAAREAWRTTAAELNLRTYSNALNWENTRSVEIFASRIDGSLQDNAALAYRAGLDGNLGQYKDYKKNVDASVVAAQGTFADEQLSEVQKGGYSNTAKSYIQGVMSRSLTDAQSLLQDPELQADLGEELPAVVNAINKAISKQQKEVVKIESKKDSDPKAYEEAVNPNGTLDEHIQGQILRGIPPSEVKPLSEKQAKQIVESTITIDNPEKMKSFVTEEVKQQYGDYTPNAFKQLQMAGLPSAYQYQLAMFSDMDTDKESYRKSTYLFDAIKPIVVGDKKKPAYTVFESQLKESGELDGFNSSFAEEWSVQDEYYRDMGFDAEQRKIFADNSRILALSHYEKTKGDSVSTSVEFATEHLFKDHKVTKIDDLYVPIPAGYDPDDIEDAAKLVRNAEVIVQNGDVAAGEVAKDTSSWKANPELTGMILVDESGIPLRDVSGIVEYTWDELKAIKTEREKLFKGAAFDEKGKYMDLIESNQDIKKLYFEKAHQYQKGINIDLEIAKKVTDKYILDKVKKPKSRPINALQGKAPLPKFRDDSDPLMPKENIDQ